MCHLLALLVHHFLHVSRIRVNQPNATVLQVYHLTFYVAQHVLCASTLIIRSLQLH
jgi:hypothetical protein